MPASRSTAWPTKPSTSTGVVSANGGSRRETASEGGFSADVSPHQHLDRNDYGLARSLCGSDGLSRASGLPNGGRRAVGCVSGRGFFAGEVGGPDLRRRLPRQLGPCPSGATAARLYSPVLSGHELARRWSPTHSRA